VNQWNQSQMLIELVDAGELIPLGDDFYEDMGGHIIGAHYGIESYFENYLKHLTPEERKEVYERMRAL
jgi:hypothetical protein